MHEHVIHPAEDCPPPGGFCRTHELNILLLAALYAVSRVLSRSLAFNESLRDVLRVLHDEAGLTRGLISGTPMVQATVRPNIIMPTACARLAGGTNDAATSAPTPK